MVDPYQAVALQTTVHHVTSRGEVEKNLKHIGDMVDLVMHICSLELPVRLIALGEGAIQGFVDEILNLAPAEYAETMATQVPGPETDFLGEKAKQHGPANAAFTFTDATTATGENGTGSGTTSTHPAEVVEFELAGGASGDYMFVA